jgi:hypothetical protein
MHVRVHARIRADGDFGVAPSVSGHGVRRVKLNNVFGSTVLCRCMVQWMAASTLKSV